MFFLRAAGAACILLALPGGLCGAEVKAAKPNVVVILLDNVGQEWFGCYGSEEHCTPNIDRLAQSGVRFANCYTTVVCGPSRVELLTGRYPHHTGWYLHHDAALYSGGGLDPKREVTVARVLRDNGYATGISGKWQVNNLYDEPDVLTQHGFQEQLVWPGSIDRDQVDEAFWKTFQEAIAGNDAEFLTQATRKIESRYWDPVLLRNGKRERATGRFGPDVFAEFATDFVHRHRDGPFFLYYPVVLTHGQSAAEHTVLTPDNRAAPPKEDKARFADMLRYADKQIGEFFDMLDKQGLRDNTIVFIASDNGTEVSLSARANGRTVQGGLYQINEAGGNVALMVNCPARITGGRTAALADFTDILPTICDLTQTAKPKGVTLDGQSFASFLLGKGEAPRKWIFNEYGPDRVVRDERYKLNQKGEFFDLDADPGEAHAVDKPDPVAAAARTRLQAVLDGMPPVTPLPFPYRSLSAFKLRAQAAAVKEGKSWRALPLITSGKIDSAWAQVGWGGFVVDNGALRAEPDDRGMGLLLYQAGKFGDCQLRILYRSEKPKSNSGIYVRLDDGILGKIGEKSLEVHRDAKGKLSPDMIKRLEESSEKHLGAWYPVHHGYEVQIMDASDAFHRTGAIYSLAKAEAVPAKPQDEWRTMIITLEGERVIVEVDGKRLSSFDAAATDLPPRQKWTEPIREIKRPTHGYIGLQNHDPGDVVWFKEVSVKPLDRSSAAVLPDAACALALK
jgi:arylsulfatase A-like enzyme